MNTNVKNGRTHIKPTMTREVMTQAPASAVPTQLPEDAYAELLRLRAENEALKAKKSSSVYFKVSELGAISIYGLGRFPVTLYKSQAEILLAKVPELKAFIETNTAVLSNGKDDPRFAEVRARRELEKAAKAEDQE